jgi:putative DNA primase/helicase
VEVTSPGASASMKLNVQKASEIKPEIITWLWENRIALGKLTLFLGHPGIGKGLITMDVAARVTTASPFPDCSNNYPVMDVLVFSSEDAASDTLVPRLMAAKADLARVGIVETTTGVDGVKQFSLDTDLPALRNAFVDNPNLKLVIIDPLLNHLGKLNGNKEQDVRSALTPLGDLAREFNAAIIIVTHPNKRTDVEAIASAGGAMAVVGCIRSAWRFMESKDEEGLRYMTPMKSNLANAGLSLSYETVGEMIFINGKETEIGKIKWGLSSSISMTDLMPGDKPTKITKSDKCLTWMVTALEKGPQPAKFMQDTATGLGFGETLVKQVKSDLKVKSTESTLDGEKKWVWALPNHEKKEIPNVE